MNEIEQLTAERDEALASAKRAWDEVGVVSHRRDDFRNRWTEGIRKRLADRLAVQPLVDAARAWREARTAFGATRMEPEHDVLWAATDRLEAAVDALTAGKVGTPDAHPESYCHRCGGPNISWSAPSPLWNEVMRGGDINGPWQFDEIICPTCFAVLAEEAGIANYWQFNAPSTTRPLTCITPSGRVYDWDRWLWVEPSALDAELADDERVFTAVGAAVAEIRGIRHVTPAARELMAAWEARAARRALTDDTGETSTVDGA